MILRALIKKEFLQLARDPRLIGFILTAPVVMVILFGLALKLEPDNAPMAYADLDRSVFSHLIKTRLWSDGYFRLYPVADRQAVIEEIRAGRALAGLVIEADFSARLVENAQPTVTVYVDGTMPSLATLMDSKAAGVTDAQVTSGMYFLDPEAQNVVVAPDPFLLDVQVLFNPDKREPWFFLPGIIGVLIMQVALILTSLAMLREKEGHTLEPLIASPITRWQFVLGKTLPYAAIAFLDFYFILAVGWWAFGLPAPASHGLLLALALLYVAGLIGLGLAISAVSQTPQQAIFLAIFILIPSILLSGFIFPLDAMPAYIRPIAHLLPFTYFVEVIRGLLLKGNGLAVLWPDYLVLAGFAGLFIGLSVWRFRKTLG